MVEPWLRSRERAFLCHQASINRTQNLCIFPHTSITLHLYRIVYCFPLLSICSLVMFGIMDVIFNPNKDEDAERVINNLLEKSNEDATKDLMMLPLEVTRAISVVLIRDLRNTREESQG
jgi:hypothetical protein